MFKLFYSKQNFKVKATQIKTFFFELFCLIKYNLDGRCHGEVVKLDNHHGWLAWDPSFKATTEKCAQRNNESKHFNGLRRSEVIFFRLWPFLKPQKIPMLLIQFAYLRSYIFLLSLSLSLSLALSLSLSLSLSLFLSSNCPLSLSRSV